MASYKIISKNIFYEKENYGLYPPKFLSFLSFKIKYLIDSFY